jgi:serine protease Do
LLTEEDINNRQLPLDTTGVVITEIASDSPIYNHLQVNDIIVELQKIKISNLNQLKDILRKSFDKG